MKRREFICPAGAGIGAIALLGDDAQALEWVRAADSALEQWIGYSGLALLNKPANFDPADAYYEGVTTPIMRVRITSELSPLALARRRHPHLQPENVTRYFVSAGSYLRRDGQVILHSVSKVNTVFQMGQAGRQMEVRLEGQKLIGATLHCQHKPAALRVNDHSMPFDHQQRERTLRFRYKGQ